MQSPELYLKELLYDFDCVTIPGFGGFVMQANHAKLDGSRHKIYPPSRYPSFNSLLKHDDGLLISRIAKACDIPYAEAGARVRDFAGKLAQRISWGETIVLEGIGQLYKGAEGNILFEPQHQANFLSNAFGLQPLNIYPVTRQVQPARTAQKRIDRTSVGIREKRPASVKWTLALSLPIILFLLYGTIFPSSVQKIYMNYSGILIGWYLSETAEPVKTKDFVEVKPIIKVAEKPVEIVPPSVTITSPEVNSEPVPTVATPDSQKYYVIGGCFEKEENAEKFLSSLIKKGYDAEKAGVTKKGHIRISYKSFGEKAPALSYLQRIKTEENEGAWLLKY
jgi:cell division septation protein DedD